MVLSRWNVPTAPVAPPHSPKIYPMHSIRLEYLPHILSSSLRQLFPLTYWDTVKLPRNIINWYIFRYVFWCVNCKSGTISLRHFCYRLGDHAPPSLPTWLPDPLTLSLWIFIFKIVNVTIRVSCHKIPTTWDMSQMRHPFLLQRGRGICWVSRRAFSGTTRAQACHTEKNQCTKSVQREHQLSQTPKCTKKPPTQTLPALSLPFWACRSTWKRAGINTLRCLVGCTAGDFSALWILQTYYPEMGMSSIMALSSGFPYWANQIVSGVLRTII